MHRTTRGLSEELKRQLSAELDRIASQVMQQAVQSAYLHVAETRLTSPTSAGIRWCQSTPADLVRFQVREHACKHPARSETEGENKHP